MKINTNFSYLTKIPFNYYFNELKESYKIQIFYLGIFFLPSAFSISALLLICSSVLGFLDREENFFQDKFNILFSISGLLMILSCIIQSIFESNIESSSWDPVLSWIGLGNFIPFFILTWGFQPYLQTIKQRKNFCFIENGCTSFHI